MQENFNETVFNCITSINTFNTPLTQLIFNKRNVSRGTVRADVSCGTKC